MAGDDVVRVVIQGCDDSTRLFVDVQHKDALLALAAATSIIGGGCRPTVHVEGDPRDDYEWKTEDRFCAKDWAMSKEELAA